MSQSAENQSAIIENENNSNIAMESQAALSAEAENFEPGGGGDNPFVDQGPDTPTQDEAGEESMEANEGAGDLVTESGDAGPEAGDAGWVGPGGDGMGAGGDATMMNLLPGGEALPEEEEEEAMEVEDEEADRGMEDGFAEPPDAGMDDDKGEQEIQEGEREGIGEEEDGGLEAADNEGLEDGDNEGLETEENMGLETEDNIGLETGDNAELETEENMGLETEKNTGLETEDNTGLETEDNTELEAEDNTGLETEDITGLETEDNAGLGTEENTGLETEENTGLDTEENIGLETEENTGLETGENAGLDAENNTELEAEENAEQETEDSTGLDAEPISTEANQGYDEEAASPEYPDEAEFGAAESAEADMGLPDDSGRNEQQPEQAGEDVSQAGGAQSQSQAESGDFSVSVEDEERLLAEENPRSQEESGVSASQNDDAESGTPAHPDASEEAESSRDPGDDGAEVIEDSPTGVVDETSLPENEPGPGEDEASVEQSEAPLLEEDQPVADIDDPSVEKDSAPAESGMTENEAPVAEDETMIPETEAGVRENESAAAEIVEDCPAEVRDDAVTDGKETTEEQSEKAPETTAGEEGMDEESEAAEGKKEEGKDETVQDLEELPAGEAVSSASAAAGESQAENIPEAVDSSMDQTVTESKDDDDVEILDAPKTSEQAQGAENVNPEAANQSTNESADAPVANDSEKAMDAEVDKASDTTIEEIRDPEEEPMMQVTDVKSGTDVTEAAEKPQEDAASKTDSANTDVNTDREIADLAADIVGKMKEESEEPAKVAEDDDDDVVVLDDVDVPARKVKQEAGERPVLNSSNDMGIQIESVSGGADVVHRLAEQQAVKQENGIDQKPAVGTKNEPQAPAQPGKKTPSKTQTCIVCKRVGKCKYNIVRNGDIKHLCDDTCFKSFRSNPTLYLKGTGSAPGIGEKAPRGGLVGNKSAKSAPKLPSSAPSYKTCVVCQLMNINTQGQFCMWKGLDFCGEGCLGKFQSNISSQCTLCTSTIPLAARSTNGLRVGNEVRPFCSPRCCGEYKLRMRLCAMCQKDLAKTKDSFTAPVGSDNTFKDFCTQGCMKRYEDMLASEVEIIRVEPGKTRGVNKCSVCQKMEMTKHAVKYTGRVHNLCSDPCLSAFQYANKLTLHSCAHCSSLCTELDSALHVTQFQGAQKRFCSDVCVTKFRLNHRKPTPCSWCGSQRDYFDMIERLDASSKFQLFCSLNCLSLYRVNLQAKSNQAVTCDQCLKFTPAQYHLTMSDASVRNFCSYNCVMSFQSQFSKPQVPTPAPTTANTPTTTTTTTPRHKHNTRGKAVKTTQQQSSPTFPIISNVVSLAPQGGQQKVNIKNSSGVPVVVSGQNVTGTGTTTQAISGGAQQQIIIQPPPPKQVKNKALLCKPLTQTKATSCRPHTQTKETQTDKVKEKPCLIPVPVPVYVPTPCALYSAPAPTPIFIPVPIPVPVFIPTTRKSASGIMKQIKEIQEKTPADPLEAELLMMAAAVSGDGNHSSDSDTEIEDLPDLPRPKKRALPMDDDNDADVMPLTSGKEEGGEEDMISMALRMAEEMSGPITDLESAVEAMPVSSEPPPAAQRTPTPEVQQDEEYIPTTRGRRGAKRGASGGRRSTPRPAKRARITVPQVETITAIQPEPPQPVAPPADANYHLKFTYGVNAWRHWVLFKNAQIERNSKPSTRSPKLFKTDILQCTADELNFSLCLFVNEVRKPSGDEYSPDSIYYLTLGIQQYLFENGRIDNIFADIYYERFTEILTELLSKCQPKFNASGQMVCRIEEEHLWECKQLGAHSPYVLLNTLIYFHTKYFMLKTPDDHLKLSFAHILKYWKKGQPMRGGQPTRSVSLRYYSVSTAKKDGSAPTSTTKKGSKEGIPVYEVTENQDNPLRCPVKLYEFYLSKCPESIKNRSDIFYPIPERSCVPDSPVWYSTIPISADIMTKMLTRVLLVREIQEAHLHAQPIYV